MAETESQDSSEPLGPVPRHGSYLYKTALATVTLGVNGTVVVCSSRLQSPTTVHLKQQKCIFSQFQRLEVQGQGVSRAGCFLGLSPQLVDDRLLPVSSYFLSSVSLCSNLLTRTPVIMDSGPP